MAEAVALGVGSCLSCQLVVDAGSLGSLDLYARTPHAFTEESVDVGLALAAHAAVAITSARTGADLRRAIDSRDLIGQAKGILVERYKLIRDQAFGVLVRASQETNRKVVDTAHELSGTGAIPADRRGGQDDAS